MFNVWGLSCDEASIWGFTPGASARVNHESS